MVRFCACGCGEITPRYRKSDSRRGAVLGEPMKFCPQHGAKPNATARTSRPRAYKQINNKYAHRLRAEQAIGKPLPALAEVHHVDGTKSIQSPLVICQDRAYHGLLHRRTRVVRAGGNPNTQRICGGCKLVKDFDEFYPSRAPSHHGYSTHCKECKRGLGRIDRNRRDYTPQYTAETTA